MEKTTNQHTFLKNSKTLILLLCLFFLHSTTAVADDTTTVYVPTDKITVNCGSREQITQEGDRSWLSDVYPVFLIVENNINRSDYTNASQPPRSGNTPPYTSVRFSYSVFTYKFPVTPGQKFIRLYFYPANSYPNLDPEKGFLTVKANRFTLLTNFSPLRNLNTGEDTILREFIVNVQQNQTLDLSFAPTTGDYYAFINGIEIVSMPTRLYYVTRVMFLGHDDYATIGNDTALETMHRVNVGGESIPAAADTTGMYRIWTEDERYLRFDGPSITVSMIFDISFRENPSYSAPIEVYQTARSMGRNKTIREGYVHKTVETIGLNNTIKETYNNLTWDFPVDSGFGYVVRLHFCELQSGIVKPGDRVFQIEIANQTAETAADVIAWSGGSGIPVYRDYGVFIGAQGNEKKRMLSVALRTTPEWRTKFSDAIINGVEIFKLSHSRNLSAFIPDFPDDQGSSRTSLWIYFCIAFFVTLVGFVIACIPIVVYKRIVYLRNKQTAIDNQNIETFIQNNRSLAPKRFNYSDVKKMTNSFSDKVGKGGFGSVYKGTLPDGSLVAVKVLNESKSTSGEDFVNEVASMSRTSHVNIVTLLGFCFNMNKRALIYEFIPNGSLDKFIYDKGVNLETSRKLSLETLDRIAVGVARGLEYLHRGCNTRIVHFDIKPHNILLDDDFCPKISDFGLAKLNQTKESIISMMGTRGTIGYIAPEVFSRNFGKVSNKSDVYSYGMMILEMVGGRTNGISQTTEVYFPDWIYNQLEPNQNLQLCGGDLTEEKEERVRKMIIVGLWCIQTIPSNRPTMTKVVEMLEGNLELLQIPPKPVLSSTQPSFKNLLTT